MNDASPAAVPTCHRHPGRETWISCQRCERPICPDCMRDASVGFQCPDCVKQGAKDTRQGRAVYGGERSSDPRLTSYVLIGINVALWLAVTATGDRGSRILDWLMLSPVGRCLSEADPNIWYPSLESRLTCQSPLTSGDGVWIRGVDDGAWWQLITSAFSHQAIWHLAMNMFALYMFGPICEQLLGRVRFLAVYFVAALGGSATVMWLAAPQSSTLGASGALFGLLGAMLVLTHKAGLDRSWLMQNLALAVIITVVGWQHISWQGHFGGLAAGAAAAAVIAYAPRERRTVVQWGGLAGLTLLLLALVAARVAVL